MKGMKGKLVKRLKSIPRVVLQVKPQDRVLQVSASDGYVENLPNISVVKFHKEETEQDKLINCSSVREQQQPDIIDVDELMRDLLTDSDDDVDDDKENITPRVKAKDPVASKESKLKQYPDSEAPPVLESEIRKQTPLSETDISSFRRPDLDSGTLFDPDLLAAFRQAVIEYMKLSEAERKSITEIQNIENNETEAEPDPLLGFEEKCPPGSLESVILYTTTLRGIRKTFDDCNSIRFLLESFRVVYFERDVSMHMEFRQELWKILDCKSVPPKLFIKGRYIGGAEEVLTLHEQGKLRPLLAGVPLDQSDGPCQGCAGVRFVVCFKCHGSHKIIAQEGESNVCPQCNENGLIVCPYCC
ncbi:uncharacterized protein At3g28850 [Rosa rugosa]|uniref:uncharacterized protein At3g28850 n=1 Tax=Rosa rugosa TaxID=74645 RepID=UPI002B40DDD6|nr:uncharacterized protein At3g28850 [Rosa rugosa]